MCSYRQTDRQTSSNEFVVQCVLDGVMIPGERICEMICANVKRSLHKHDVAPGTKAP